MSSGVISGLAPGMLSRSMAVSTLPGHIAFTEDLSSAEFQGKGSGEPDYRVLGVSGPARRFVDLARSSASGVSGPARSWGLLLLLLPLELLQVGRLVVA